MRKTLSLFLFFCLTVSFSCDSGEPSGGDADADTSTDSDVSADSETDSTAGELGQCPSGEQCEDERTEMMELLADDRAPHCAKNPLERDSTLDAVAQQRSVAMAIHRSFSPPDLPMLRDRLAQHEVDMPSGYDAGENAGRNFSVEELQLMFWNYEPDEEPGTYPMRERMIDCEFERVGIGIAVDRNGRYWGTQTFFTP